MKKQPTTAEKRESVAGKPPGPEPERLKLSGEWEAAVKKALTKKPPPPPPAKSKSKRP